MTAKSPDAEATHPPGPDGYPLVGNAFQLARNPLEFPERCAREYGDVVGIRFAGQTAVLLSNPADLKYVLAENAENYWKGEYFNKQLQVLGDGLFASDGELWRRQRRLMDPIFHPDEIASYGDMMVRYAGRLADEWSAGEPTAMEADMMQLALENVTNALFNVDVTDEVPEIVEAIQAVMDNFRRSRRLPVEVPDWLPTPGKIRYRRAVDTFDEIVDEIIREHREADDPPDDVVSMLLAAGDEDGSGMSEEQIRDEVLTLLLAGHDTTGLAMTYIWYLLATHPAVEERLVAELENVLGGRTPTLSDLPELGYLERVMKEALRLYPPVYFFVREPYEDDVIRGHRIPSGSMVMFYQWVIHRDDRFYDDPESFRPERWTAEFESNLHPFAYIPFGGGPRRCIGEHLATMEIKLVVATIAQRYGFDLGFEPPIEFDPMMSLRPASSVELIPRPR